MAEIQFLFDNQLIAALENLIKQSKHRLVLISPFIDLDKRIQDALREKLTKHDFELHVLFGKNEDNIYKSIKKDSLEFLKQFPNIQIRYNERLHAKFYCNDFDFIMTSLNLYDFSLAKNIEVGIIGNYASKGLLGKVMDGTDNVIAQGVDKVKQDVLGMGNKEVNPIEKFKSIFENSELKYETSPIVVDQGGITGFLGAKKLNGFNVIQDKLAPLSKENKETSIEKPVSIISGSGKNVSASQLSKSLKIPQNEITDLMQKSGFINGDKITEAGLTKGLSMKNYMGKDYISYPENLEEFNSIKNRV
ncbi:MAG: hypothetical protein K0S53_1908 [Bacteroidetes bacterium]|jgi:hypothetical protein|nr:hypothetical protein [Bacteroidota bacterium]